MEDMLSHFKKLNASGEGEINNNNTDLITSKLDSNSNLTLNEEIRDDEILKVIKTLKPGKAPGDDGISNDFLKSTVNLFLPVYRYLFNKIIDTGIIPECWKMGLIIPLYKNKGDRADPDNYRAITLLSCLSKVFTTIVNNRLTSFVSLLDNQAGFRKKSPYN